MVSQPIDTFGSIIVSPQNVDARILNPLAGCGAEVEKSYLAIFETAGLTA